MLDLRPNCELCDGDLPAESTEARICTYECTFCSRCVDDVLRNVCPNCGGGFAPRPIRPATARRPGISRGHQPAQAQRVHTKWTRDEIEVFAAEHTHVAPERR